MTENQFWDHLRFLIDNKGWSIRVEKDGSVRLARPRMSDFCFCPITAVYKDLKGGKSKKTDEAKDAGEELGIGPRIIAKIMKLADDRNSYPSARPAWLKRFGLKAA